MCLRWGGGGNVLDDPGSVLLFAVRARYSSRLKTGARPAQYKCSGPLGHFGCAVVHRHQVALLYPTRCAIWRSDSLPDFASTTECRGTGRFHGGAVGPGAHGRAIGLSAQIDAEMVGVGNPPEPGRWSLTG